MRLPRKIPKAGYRPIITKGHGTRGQFDLIDFSSIPAGVNRTLKNLCVLLHTDNPLSPPGPPGSQATHLGNYQDHGSKFQIPILLHHATAKAVALGLSRVFCILGAPAILHTDNGEDKEVEAGIADRRVSG